MSVLISAVSDDNRFSTSAVEMNTNLQEGTLVQRYRRDAELFSHLSHALVDLCVHW